MFQIFEEVGVTVSKLCIHPYLNALPLFWTLVLSFHQSVYPPPKVKYVDQLWHVSLYASLRVCLGGSFPV